MRITVCLHATTHEDVAHDREIVADTVDDTISLPRWFSCHQKTYLDRSSFTSRPSHGGTASLFPHPSLRCVSRVPSTPLGR